MMKFSTVVSLALLFGCGDDGPPALFPADYALTYQEVRDCRNSIDHDLTRIRIVANAEAMTAYLNRTDEFPVGAILLKEQYDSGDTDCTGPILQYSVMKKLDTTDNLGWDWQETDHEFVVNEEKPVKRCVGCHTSCGVPPEGYLGSCAVP